MNDLGYVADYNDEPDKNYEQELIKKDKTIRKLKRKVKSCQVMVATAEYLQESCNQHEEWTEKIKCEHKMIVDNLENTINIQLQKIKEFQTEKQQWEARYKELQNVNNCISEQLKYVNKDASKFGESEKNNNYIYQQLCDTEYKIDTLKYDQDMLSNELNTKSKELTDMTCENETLKYERDMLSNEFNTKCKELIDMTCENETLKYERDMLSNEFNMKCKELTDMTCENETLKYERDMLSNEFNTKCEELNDMTVKYENADCKVKDGMSTIKALQQLREENTNNHCELKNLIKDIKENNRAKNDDWFLTQERDKLANELKTKCKDLRNLTAKYKDAECKIKDDEGKIHLLTNTLQKLIEGSKQNNFVLTNKIKKLEKMNLAKEGDCFTKHERDLLVSKLNSKCKELNHLTAKYKDADFKIKDGVKKINFLANSLKELLEGSKKNNFELKNKIKKLEEMNRAKENDLLYLKTKIKPMVLINEQK